MFNIKNLRKAKAEIKHLEDIYMDAHKNWCNCLSEKYDLIKQIEQLKSQLPNRDTKNGRFTSKKK